MNCSNNNNNNSNNHSTNKKSLRKVFVLMIENSWEIKNWFQIHSQFANLLKLIPMSFGLCVVFWFYFLFSSFLFATKCRIWHLKFHVCIAQWICGLADCCLCIYLPFFSVPLFFMLGTCEKSCAAFPLSRERARPPARLLARLHIYTLPHLNMNEKYFMIGATCLQLLRLFSSA